MDEVRTGRYQNPFLLLAEADRHLAEMATPARKKDFLLEAVREYGEAMLLEEEARSPEEASPWEKQFLSARSPVPAEREIRVRQRRRRMYLQYFRAVTTLDLGRNDAARKELELLRNALAEEGVERLKAEREGRTPVSEEREVPLRAYELLPEEKIKIQFHLARVYDALGLTEKAEEEYRVFLLQSPRSRDRFLAQMRLGAIAVERGQRLMDASQDLPAAERDVWILRAREAYGGAALLYGRSWTRARPRIFSARRISRRAR
ncbi:MAG: hypothetical protein V1918_07480 [Planctomycetota bacterium]